MEAELIYADRRTGMTKLLGAIHDYAKSYHEMLISHSFSFYSKTYQMHHCLKFILFWITLYTFRTVFPSIVRSSRLYIQQQKYVKQILRLLASKQSLYLFDICLLLYVPNSRSICLTFACCCMYSLELLTMDGKTVRNM